MSRPARRNAIPGGPGFHSSLSQKTEAQTVLADTMPRKRVLKARSRGTRPPRTRSRKLSFFGGLGPRIFPVKTRRAPFVFLGYSWV